uniref:trypsin n=1 Tax=Sinocyclocheilus grahami TaxID=75366 RepID=A0A672RPD7_SINGR
VGEFDRTKTDPDEQIMKVNLILSERVTPVCLPSDLDPPAGTPCLVAGWGSLYEEPNNITQYLLQMLALGKELLTNTMFCAGYLSGGTDSCQVSPHYHTKGKAWCLHTGHRLL